MCWEGERKQEVNDISETELVDGDHLGVEVQERKAGEALGSYNAQNKGSPL